VLAVESLKASGAGCLTQALTSPIHQPLVKLIDAAHLSFGRPRQR